MQTFTIEVAHLQEIVTTSLDRLLGEIDPSLEKVKNVTVEVLSIIEERIQANVADVVHWAETNLFFLLLGAILFFIMVAGLLTLVDNLLIRYGFSVEQRRFVGLALITVLFIYLLVAATLLAWPSTERPNLQSLKYALFGLLIVVVVYLAFVWVCDIWFHRHRLCEYLPVSRGCKPRNRILIKGRTITAQRNEIELPAVY